MKRIQERPENIFERSDREVRVYDFLDQLDVSYQRMDHPRVMTMAECDAIGEKMNAHVCKNLLLTNRQKTKFYLLMMDAHKPFKTKELSKQIQSARLSFATAEFMERYLDTLPGSLSVMGLINDDQHEVTLLIDEDLFNEAYIGIHPCENSTTLALSSKELFNIVIPALNHRVMYVHLIGE